MSTYAGGFAPDRGTAIAFGASIGAFVAIVAIAAMDYFGAEVGTVTPEPPEPPPVPEPPGVGPPSQANIDTPLDLPGNITDIDLE
jgi:hypothetical protein